MLASPIFHHSRHIRLSLSISSFVTSLSLPLLYTHTHLASPPRHSFALLALSFSLPPSHFRTRGVPLSHVAASSTPPHFTPTQCPNVSLLAHPHSIASLPSSPLPPSPPLPANILSRSFDPSQSRTRNLIQNVPNAIHIIILVADNGKFV